MYLVQSPMSSRNQFGHFLSAKGLLGDAVEVGTHRGEFAKILMRNWKGRLYCVDPWRDIQGYEPQAEMLKAALGGSPNREDDLLAAKVALSRWKDSVFYLKCTSLEAVTNFRDNTLDFVYIDGDHRPDYVYSDLVNWWKKIKVGGILAGHDFLMPGEPDGGWGKGIQWALTKFTNVVDVPVYLIVEEENLPWSYFLIKEN